MAPPATEEIVALSLPRHNDLWWLMGGGELRHRSLSGDKDAPQTKPNAEVQNLIDKLASDEYVQRQRASEKLAALGAAVRPQLEKAAAASTDVEQQTRIKVLLKRIAAAPAGKTLCGFGAIEVGDVQQLWQDAQGRVFVQASVVVQPRGRSGSGLAVLNADGKTQAVFFDDAAAPGALQPRRLEEPPILDATTGWLLLSNGAPFNSAYGSWISSGRKSSAPWLRRSCWPSIRRAACSPPWARYPIKASSACFAAARQGISNSPGASHAPMPWKPPEGRLGKVGLPAFLLSVRFFGIDDWVEQPL